MEARARELDVRHMPAGTAQATIIGALLDLPADTTVLLASSQDLFPLRYQPELEAAGPYEWTNVHDGPTFWLFSVRRPA